MTVAVIPPCTSLRLKQKIVGSVFVPYPTKNGDVLVGGSVNHHVHHFDMNMKKLNNWRTPGNNIPTVLVHGNSVLVSQCTPPKSLNYSCSGVLHGEILGSTRCYTGLTIGPDRQLYAPGANVINIGVGTGGGQGGLGPLTFFQPEPYIEKSPEKFINKP